MKDNSENKFENFVLASSLFDQSFLHRFCCLDENNLYCFITSINNNNNFSQF